MYLNQNSSAEQVDAERKKNWQAKTFDSPFIHILRATCNMVLTTRWTEWFVNVNAEC